MNVFTRHPRTAGETYIRHAAFALRLGFCCISAGLAAVIHAVFPFLFETTASREIVRMYRVLEENGRVLTKRK